MSETLAIRIPRQLKEAMKRLSKTINWPEEIRAFIENRIREAEAEENMNRVIELLKQTRGVEQGFSAEVVRKDRDSR